MKNRLERVERSTSNHNKINMVIIGSSLLVLILLTAYIYYNLSLAQKEGINKTLWIKIHNRSKSENNIPIAIKIGNKVILENNLDSVINIHKDLKLFEGEQLIEIITHDRYVNKDTIYVSSMRNHGLFIDYLDNVTHDKVPIEYSELFTD